MSRTAPLRSQVRLTIFLFLPLFLFHGDGFCETAAVGVIDQKIAETAYAGDENFSYDIFWSGGIKIGEMHQKLVRSDACGDCYEIHSTITSTGGIIHALYPVKDVHVTSVKGRERLPYFSEIWVQEGRSYRAHKKITYDQSKYTITKQKNDERITRYSLEGTVHNEFSAFFSSRVMDFREGRKFLVPTFGDDRRNEVIVEVAGRETLEDTCIGKVKAVRVTPILTFSGLYDKRGDTIIWYTDDDCRVPVLIRSKIIIGSLTARLTSYSNPRCGRYAR